MNINILIYILKNSNYIIYVIVWWVQCSLFSKKMVLDVALFNTQHYKVRIKGKVNQSRELSSTLYYTLV